jgi:nitrate reductase NapE component
VRHAQQSCSSRSLFLLAIPGVVPIYVVPAIHRQTTTRQAKGPAQHRRFRFGLRSLFVLLAGVGVFCAAVRSLVSHDIAIVLGIGAFCYGGIVAIPCYAFVGSLMVLTTTTTRGQRVGEVLAAVVGAAAWITFIVVALGKWPQLCVAYSLVAVAMIVWLVRHNWQIAEGPSPETTLNRLIAAKRSCQQQTSRGENELP